MVCSTQRTDANEDSFTLKTHGMKNIKASIYSVRL